MDTMGDLDMLEFQWSSALSAISQTYEWKDVTVSPSVNEDQNQRQLALRRHEVQQLCRARQWRRPLHPNEEQGLQLHTSTVPAQHLCEWDNNSSATCMNDLQH
ncbi:hypothetical protein NQZ68_018404 [Dissostichus eleginoides]|nr:hypothetical protein NQZ68_018404 [Dissostichus eleginoides]